MVPLLRLHPPERHFRGLHGGPLCSDLSQQLDRDQKIPPLQPRALLCARGARNSRNSDFTILASYSPELDMGLKELKLDLI